MSEQKSEFPASVLVKFDLDWTRLSPAERSLLQALIEKMDPKKHRHELVLDDAPVGRETAEEWTAEEWPEETT